MIANLISVIHQTASAVMMNTKWKRQHHPIRKAKANSVTPSGRLTGLVPVVVKLLDVSVG